SINRLARGKCLAHELVGLATRRAVADRYQLHAVPRDHRAQRTRRTLALARRLVREHRLVLEEFPGAVDRHHLATRTESGIDAERGAHPGGTRQQQLA